jgi:AcrR family transcriptional regulator
MPEDTHQLEADYLTPDRDDYTSVQLRQAVAESCHSVVMTPSGSPASDLVRPAFALRTERKLATTRALQEAALLLFAQRGYEETSAAEIALLAGVSVRTFYVHFATKEDVLFGEVDRGIRDRQESIIAAPSALSDLSAVEFAALQGINMLDKSTIALQHRINRLRVQAAETSSVVRGVRLKNARTFTAAVAEALGRRRGEHPLLLETLTIAEIASGAQFLSLEEWASAKPGDLKPIIRRRFDSVRKIAVDRQRI